MDAISDRSDSGLYSLTRNVSSELPTLRRKDAGRGVMVNHSLTNHRAIRFLPLLKDLSEPQAPVGKS
jgi:hypothetical protein